jgi:hypothetical protein
MWPGDGYAKVGRGGDVSDRRRCPGAPRRQRRGPGAPGSEQGVRHGPKRKETVAQ